MTDASAKTQSKVAPENAQCLSAREHCLVVQKPMRVLSRDEAIAAAAWLVALAELLPGDGPAFGQFAETFDLIRRT